jgi:hypothetical protein
MWMKYFQNFKPHTTKIGRHENFERHNMEIRVELKHACLAFLVEITNHALEISLYLKKMIVVNEQQ